MRVCALAYTHPNLLYFSCFRSFFLTHTLSGSLPLPPSLSPSLTFSLFCSLSLSLSDSLSLAHTPADKQDALARLEGEILAEEEVEHKATTLRMFAHSGDSALALAKDKVCCVVL